MSNENFNMTIEELYKKKMDIGFKMSELESEQKKLDENIRSLKSKTCKEWFEKNKNKYFKFTKEDGWNTIYYVNSISQGSECYFISGFSVNKIGVLTRFGRGFGDKEKFLFQLSDFYHLITNSAYYMKLEEITVDEFEHVLDDFKQKFIERR